ncbi:UvrD-helicase domain-containing protein [Candidatus Woesearchaeota archaeon]|nr:UvrD-helicase domain-containing protein [Candidatus Woesearchaeota archaeon]
MEFNPDGSLKVPKKVVRDHISVFHLISELPFPIGKKLLIKLLRGEIDERIKKLRLDNLVHHGSLGGYEENELAIFLEVLISKGFLTTQMQKGRYQVVSITPLGFEELEQQQFELKVDTCLGATTPDDTTLVSYEVASITNDDRKIFAELDFFLKEFTDEQKKAIICLDKKQVCIAGAGSGKTSVLTNKIVFLVKYAGINSKDILAITFTRKARQEMLDRLALLLPKISIRVETFNSFAEQELQRHGTLLYGQEKEMVDNKEFLNIVVKSLNHLGFTVETFVKQYFLPNERRNKESRQLFFSFLYDFRTILDAYITHGKEENYFTSRLIAATLSERVTAQNVARLASLVTEELEARGLRTFADQLVDINKLYARNEEVKPFFSWVLVDEYQDVNEQQILFLEKLNPAHLFVVGDPRQSIYAWRGANPQTMFDFIQRQPTVLELTTNFRSSKKIVSFANTLISQANAGKNIFSSLRSASNEDGGVTIERYQSEEFEAQSIVTKIQALAIPRDEIFVLSRTNKGLDALATTCLQESIPFVMRTEERVQESSGNEIVLSTVHAIKGLEAKVVFVIGASGNNYPCRAKDHHFVELFAGKESYDVYEEERRIFYVACTRAKQVLQISYTGVPTPFLSTKVLSSIDIKLTGLNDSSKVTSKKRLAEQKSALRRWRFLESKERNIPPYLVFSDKVLEQLLQLQPVSLEDLEQVKGFGKAKIDEFGLDILHMLQH